MKMNNGKPIYTKKKKNSKSKQTICSQEKHRDRVN